MTAQRPIARRHSHQAWNRVSDRHNPDGQNAAVNSFDVGLSLADQEVRLVNSPRLDEVHVGHLGAGPAAELDFGAEIDKLAQLGPYLGAVDVELEDHRGRPVVVGGERQRPVQLVVRQVVRDDGVRRRRGDVAVEPVHPVDPGVRLVQPRLEVVFQAVSRVQGSHDSELKATEAELRKSVVGMIALTGFLALQRNGDSLDHQQQRDDAIFLFLASGRNWRTAVRPRVCVITLIDQTVALGEKDEYFSMQVAH
ncbi:hypothetical protein MTO96_009015 [Rhipicephalus appendiculatus]